MGTLILAGKPDPSLTNSGNFALAVDGTGNPVIQPFDLFNPGNYPGIVSVTGAGSALVGASVTSFDPAFFLTPVIQLAFNTSTTIPFATTDPWALFVGLPGGGAPTVTPNIGTINGVNGTDFQLQSDANNSFVAAAPAIAIAKQTNGQTALTPTGPHRHRRQHRDLDLRRHQPRQRATQKRHGHRRQRHARQPRR